MKSDKPKKIFRFPFDINPKVFLAFAAFFFLISTKYVSKIIFPETTINQIVKEIEKDIDKKITRFNAEMKDTELINKALNQNLNKEEQKYLLGLPIEFQLFSDNQIKYWNTQNTDAIDADTLKENVCYYLNDKTKHLVLYCHSIDTTHNTKAILVIPIKKDFSINNIEYPDLIYALPHKQNIVANIAIDNPNADKNFNPVRYKNQTIFQIEIEKDILKKDNNDFSNLWIKAIFFIFFGISIHTYFKIKVKTQKPIYIFSILILTILITRLLTYKFNFLVDFSEYSLFYPETFANDVINKSIGDLLINMCLAFWALIFYAINIQGKIFKISNSKYSYLFAVIISIFGSFLIRRLINIIYALVFDSVINFDITFISKIDILSLIGHIIVLIISANIFVVCWITNSYLKEIFKNIYQKYLIIFLTFVITFLFVPNKYDVNLILYIPIILLIYLLTDFTYSKIKFELNSNYLNLWFITISTLSAFILITLIIKKDREFIDFTADKLIEEKNIQFEFKLDKIYNQIQEDKTLISKMNAGESYQKISSYLFSKYISLIEESPKTAIFIFDKHNKNINGFDTLSNNNLQEIYRNKNKINSEFNKSINILTNKTNNQIYLLDIKLNDSVKYYGNIVIGIYSQKYQQIQNTNTLYNPITNQLNTNILNYSYAIYDNEKLVFQSDDYGVFYSGVDINRNFLPDKNNTIHYYDNGYNMTYKAFPNLKKSILIAKKNNYFNIFIFLLSYSFFIYLTTIYLYIIGNILARSNLNLKRLKNLLSLNLRFKIQISIIFIVLLSFFSIGYIFIKNSNNEIEKEIKVKLVQKTTMLKNQFLYYCSRLHENTKFENQFIKTQNLINIANQLSEKYNISISLFNAQDGVLQYSTQNNLLQKGFFCNLIPQNVFYNLIRYHSEHEINYESDNQLNYLAGYFLLNDKADNRVAIVQIPNILYSYEITKQSNDLLVRIINISVFVFFIVYILSHFLSKSVSNPFRIIVNKFTKINLEETNEPLVWESSDEIGLLVKQYNRMLKKLENSTKLLAKNQRELAWREMAKQVAHEIKNPLTSMKLSIQILERAINNKSPNITELTQKVSNTIIEQIEVLTIIATDFSMYAKLPEVKRENVDIYELLLTSTGLYNDNNNIEYLFYIPNFKIQLYVDKNQLFRVITNIIQNAIQSIPSNQKGYITLELTKLNNSYIRIAISDNGVGIAEDKKAFLFTPYFTTKSSGSGIGLAMCKDIIEQFGGKIHFESEIHKGTTFYIDLPFNTNDEEDKASSNNRT